jgi:uncharacterized protein (TIGR03663 family)
LNLPRHAVWLFAAITVVAAAYRFPDLSGRPMHADEAVHADKLGELLEHGRYEYSTADYHGPTLYYLALVSARAQGIRRYADLNEVTLRAVPAVFGVLLVAAHFLLIPYLGLPVAACAALFTAVSPAMVYYSRYFIHETLLEFFTFAAMLAVLGYWRRPGVGPALVAGAMFGLMFATKETWMIPAVCMLAAGIAHKRWPTKEIAEKADRQLCPLPGSCAKSLDYARGQSSLSPFSVYFAILAFLVVAALCMSSFLTHPRGILDSILAYRTYFARGAGVDTLHVHPWYFYFQRLLYFHGWSEGLIAGLALVGIWVSQGIGRWLAIYTLLMIAIYCAIPYKVPWNLLGFLHGLIMMAAIGVVWLAEHASRAMVVALVGIGMCHLAWEARAASFPYAADARNPWVYAHTGTDVFVITREIAALAAVHPAGLAMPVQIITSQNLWPLPWYFRRYSGVRWWNGVSMTTPAAPVILATPEMEPGLVHRLYAVPPPGQRELYVPMFDRYRELRPSVEVRGYVSKSLWDQLP